MEEYLAMWRNYTNFTDRTTLRGYWMAFLYNILAMLGLSVISYIIHTQLLYSLYALAVIIPSLAITVRRLHDTGRSGGWIFISLVPLIGEIWLIILLCQSTVEDYRAVV